jgi:tetratricopeptide (TPR) repeat protein
MNKDRFFDLLTRKDLNEEEKKELQSYIAADEEAAELSAVYNAAGKILKDSAHPSIDELSDYVLYKNNMEPVDNSVLKRIPVIEAHLKTCSECGTIYLELSEELNEVSGFVKKEFAGKQPHIKAPAHTAKIHYSFRFVYAAAALILLIFIGGMGVSYFVTPPAYRSLTNESPDELYRTRGRETNSFLQAVEALDNEDYNAAINDLKQDIKNNPNDETIFYSSYLIGLTYLHSAGSNFAGLFQSYDKEKVSEAIKYLKMAIEKNTSGKYINVNYDAWYYIGRGYLMLNDVKDGENYLNMVIKSRGSKMEESRRILSQLK